ncbi:ABC transporter ATP-binding protein [Roseivirga thermotolerans]|uniref:ABC transporter n=3 Tax=Roseivirga TaxID=290180 RepID=A0ABQ3I1Z5_9BACT|nr:ABC transporter ATP-binding protein [Roseivirga thermotolerans]MEC7756145.1 ABC transporter ATP-binding protein [Bacteroidota bacterium]GHE50459.1 ABC transporter [Roseivirga thermotolerans]
MKELKHLNKYLLKYKWLLILGFIFLVISNYFGVWPAKVVRYAIDYVTDSFRVYRLFEGSGLSESVFDKLEVGVLILGGIMILMAFLRGFFLFLVRQTIIVMSRKIEYDLKNEVFEQYQNLPLSFYRKNNTGDLMNRISEDVSQVRMYLGPGIMYGINLLVLFPMVIYEMLRVNVELTIYALLPLPVLSLSIYFVNNVINKRSEKIQESLSDLSTSVQEAFSGIRVLKAFVREKDSAAKFANESEKYKHRSLKLTFVNALFFPLIMALIGLSVLLTIYIGGTKVIQGEITYGNIAEFVIYVNMLTWPVTALGWITSINQRAAASQKRINQFLQETNHIQSTENLQRDIKGDVSFDNVSFVYPDSGIRALQNVSFDVKAGQSIAIIGTTGSGKSTIANLMLRLYDSSSGSITIDGKDIRAYNISNMRDQMGYVPQDVFLFSDTIQNNIAFGSNSISYEQVVQAAKDADLYDNITDFPKGLQTMLGERGITLSGGQKQRASIARAIVRNPKILILDDALSAVDTNTENTILNSLSRIMKGRTTVIISHRVSSAKLADKIIVLDDGKIIEQGTNESLLALNGVYKELYDKQLKEKESVE